MRESSNFNLLLLLFAGCCAVAGFIGWPMIKAAFPDSFPQEQRGGEPRYDQYGYTGDPGRFDRWRNAERGGQREGFSQFYPRDGGRPDPNSYVMRRRGEDGEGDRAEPLQRPPQTSGYGGRRMCLDGRTQRPVDPELCERQHRRQPR